MANILIKQGLEIAVPDFVITTDEARKVDLTSIIQTGTTSSQAISAGTYFYLNNTLVRAKADIANGATFTLNTNYEVVTAGALNELKNAIDASGYTITENSLLGSITYSQIAKLNNKLLIDVVFASTANSTSGQAIFSIKKDGNAISCTVQNVFGQRLQNDGNSAYCPVTATGVVSAGPSYPIASSKIYHFNFILNLT